MDRQRYIKVTFEDGSHLVFRGTLREVLQMMQERVEIPGSGQILKAKTCLPPLSPFMFGVIASVLAITLFCLLSKLAEHFCL